MNKAANFIGRVVIFIVVWALLTAMFYGAFDLIYTIWLEVPRPWRVGAISAACTAMAWRIVWAKGAGHA